MDLEKSSLCNCVVNFLLEENYYLTAFELLHELLDDGRDDQAIRLKSFFSDTALFPPDQITRFNALRVADPQTLLQEKDAVEEKLAITEYELRLAQEDISKFKTELLKQAESPATQPAENATVNNGPKYQRQKSNASFSDLGPLKDNERRDLNCAVKEYLLLAGYRLTAMTFFEEVTDQNLDGWQNSPACVPDALRHYYYQYLSSTTEAAEEKISMLRKNESLLEENEKLNHEKLCLVKNKDMAEGQISALKKSLESLQKELKDKENLVRDLRQSLEHERKELNGCRAEVTALKVHIEGSRLGQNMVTSDVDNVQSLSLEEYKEELKSLQTELEILRSKFTNAPNYVDSIQAGKELMQVEEKVVVMDDEKSVIQLPDDARTKVVKETDHDVAVDNNLITPKEVLEENSVNPSNGSGALATVESVCIQNVEPSTSGMFHPTIEDNSTEIISEKRGLETIQILADALPKIVPYVLINHREELLPLIMCAIEHHPESSTRDSLTHTLFNLIKRPDEKQRRIIMDACVSLAQNVGEMRTETELLPQCWEQINHTYEERRLLVAQSCGELAEFVRPEIRDSLILSIIQQLVEDAAIVVREASVHNLALLLPLFPNMDKYFKVEEMMFQLICDPSGVVVDTTLEELVPAVIKWGHRLDHVLRVLLSYILSSVERCPPLSGVEESMESHLRVLGERERWNVDVLLRMLLQLIPFVHQKAVEMSPFSSDPETTGTVFSTPFLEFYAGGHVQLPAFEWLHVDCLPDLIQLACLLPPKEDTLRNRITRILLAVSEHYGDSYSTHIMLPVFLIAIGEDAQLTYFPSASHSKIEALSPRTAVMKRLATRCILPLLLAGVLGAPSKHDQLVEYLRKLLVESAGNQSLKFNNIADAVRFLCTFEIHHGMIFNILWEMVVSSNIDMKINATNLLKVIVPYIDAKVASTNILPALVTLGSDQNLSVKYASIISFGSVAQHFKNDMIVDKIQIQMDAFLEDGSHEATIAVVHALVVAVPHTTDRLKDYLLSKIFHLTGSPPVSDMMHRRERANAFCEAIRALDATDISANSVRDYLLPTVQNLLRDSDALDPVHKEALEIIMKERSGGSFETIGKVMSVGIASSVSSFFGEGGLLGKKDNVDPLPEPVSPESTAPPPAEDTRLRRIMRGNFTDMLRGKVKGQDDPQHQ